MEPCATGEEGEADDAYEGAEEDGEDDGDVRIEGEGVRRIRCRR